MHILLTRVVMVTTTWRLAHNLVYFARSPSSDSDGWSVDVRDVVRVTVPSIPSGDLCRVPDVLRSVGDLLTEVPGMFLVGVVGPAFGLCWFGDALAPALSLVLTLGGLGVD